MFVSGLKWCCREWSWPQKYASTEYVFNIFSKYNNSSVLPCSPLHTYIHKTFIHNLFILFIYSIRTAILYMYECTGNWIMQAHIYINLRSWTQKHTYITYIIHAAPTRNKWDSVRKQATSWQWNLSALFATISSAASCPWDRTYDPWETRSPRDRATLSPRRIPLQFHRRRLQSSMMLASATAD